MKIRWVGFLVVVAVLGLAAVAVTTPRPLGARESRAQLQCRSLAQQAESYYLDPRSGSQYPENLQQLLQPPFGGTLLKNGREDLIDPWGQPYQLRFIAGQDDAKAPLVHTTTPDGKPVSQYGIGPLSRVP